MLDILHGSDVTELSLLRGCSPVSLLFRVLDNWKVFLYSGCFVDYLTAARVIIFPKGKRKFVVSSEMCLLYYVKNTESFSASLIPRQIWYLESQIKRLKRLFRHERHTKELNGSEEIYRNDTSVSLVSDHNDDALLMLIFTSHFKNTFDFIALRYVLLIHKKVNLSNTSVGFLSYPITCTGREIITFIVPAAHFIYIF